MRDTRSIKDQRESLPIFKMREELLKGLTANQVILGRFQARSPKRGAWDC